MCKLNKKVNFYVSEIGQKMEIEVQRKRDGEKKIQLKCAKSSRIDRLLDKLHNKLLVEIKTKL